MRLPLSIALLFSLGAFSAFAGELGVGSSRDEVVAQLGLPKSKLNANGREIFGYPGGRITLIGGKVDSIDWKGELPRKPASGSIAPPSATATAAVAAPAMAPAAKPAVLTQTWSTDFAAAQAEAEKSKRRLLVLFTGSDWCPPCMRFEAEVAHAEDFLKVTRVAFVLVKLDYPRNTPQKPEVRARNEELRRKYGVNSYPSLLVISADGSKSTRVDTSKPREASDIVDFYVQAVDEARKAKEKSSSFWPW